jgi:hypothetical protein
VKWLFWSSLPFIYWKSQRGRPWTTSTNQCTGLQLAALCWPLLGVDPVVGSSIHGLQHRESEALCESGLQTSIICVCSLENRSFLHSSGRHLPNLGLQQLQWHDCSKADGSQTTANLQVTAELQMRKCCHDVTFQATALLPQFDSRFGSDWSNQHQVGRLRRY